MKLQEIVNQLRVSEFSQISIGGAGMGVIDETNLPIIVSHINLGLTALYRRFNLKESRMMVTLVPGVPEYPLPSYVHKVQRVLTDTGWELGLNDTNNTYACWTPSLNVLGVPEELTDPTDQTPDWARTDKLIVHYQANHPPVTVATVDVELPDSHLEALLYFVASRAHNPIGMSNEFHAGNTYAQKYELACQELERHNMKIDVGMTSQRLRQKGFP